MAMCLNTPVNGGNHFGRAPESRHYRSGCVNPVSGRRKPSMWLAYGRPGFLLVSSWSPGGLGGHGRHMRTGDYGRSGRRPWGFLTCRRHLTTRATRATRY